MEDTAGLFGHRKTPASVSGVIEDQVLPRLVNSHRLDCSEGALAGCVHPEAVRTLAELVVDYDLNRATSLIESRRADGASLENIMIDYLTPAARYLGSLWEDDRIDFTTVTIAVGRLQQIHHGFRDEFEQDAPVIINSRRVLLAPAPGDQHTFGISMVGSFLRRDGWDVAGGPATTEAALLERVRREHFDVIGFGVGYERWAETLGTTIDRLRNESRNPDLGVLLGGALPMQQPALGDHVGADAVVSEGHLISNIAQSVIGGRGSSD